MDKLNTNFKCITHWKIVTKNLKIVLVKWWIGVYVQRPVRGQVSSAQSSRPSPDWPYSPSTSTLPWGKDKKIVSSDEDNEQSVLIKDLFLGFGK